MKKKSTAAKWYRIAKLAELERYYQIGREIIHEAFKETPITVYRIIEEIDSIPDSKLREFLTKREIKTIRGFYKRLQKQTKSLTNIARRLKRNA